MGSFNVIDYIFIGAVIVYMLFGFLSGLGMQILGWVELAVAALAGYLFYRINGNILLLPLIVIASGILFAVIIKIIRTLYLNFSGRERRILLSSRVLGALVGGLRGVVIGGFYLVSIYVFSIVFLNNSLFTNKFVKPSFFCSFIHRHNLIGSLRFVEAFNKNGGIFKRDKNGNITVNKEITERLQKVPSFKALLKDKDIMNSIKNKDYKKLLSNPKFIRLFKDKEFLKQLKSIIMSKQH